VFEVAKAKKEKEGGVGGVGGGSEERGEERNGPPGICIAVVVPLNEKL
jgi:hypothetical protein